MPGRNNFGGTKPLSQAQMLKHRKDEEGDTTWFQTHKYDPDKAPKNSDKEVWHLVLLFQQYAASDGIELPVRRPTIYLEINELVARHGMRDRTYPQEIYGCGQRVLPASLSARCWLHWPPQDPGKQVARAITWVEMTEIILAEFWSRIWDADALDHLGRHFAEYGRMATDHWKSLRISQAIDAQPKDHRPIVHCGRMLRDSKEG